VELEPRLLKLETAHTILAEEFKQIDRPLEKIELAIEKQSVIMGDLKVLTSKIEAQDKRVCQLEATLSKLLWVVVTAFVGALITVVPR
jgi:hypothetical protein